ncbi:MAG TPA: hypothetical protein VIT92_03735 [Burkholderiaceae bacterium]
MNLSKHMEAVFLAAAVLACATGYANAAQPAVVTSAKVAVAEVAGLQTVTITAKRLAAPAKGI